MRRICSWRYRHAPWKLADLNRLDDLWCGDIDHGDVVGDAVRHQQIFLVWRKRQVPDPLPHQKIFGHSMACGVDHRYAVSGTKRNKRGLVVLAHGDPDRLDGLAPQSGNLKGDL